MAYYMSIEVGPEYHEALNPVSLGPCVCYNVVHRYGVKHSGTGFVVYLPDGEEWYRNAGLAEWHTVGDLVECESSMNRDCPNEHATMVS